MIWIGVEFDTVAMTVRIPDFRIEETLDLLRDWHGKTCATRHDIQKILGKLHFISRCVKPARLFVNRMLDTLRAAPATGVIQLSANFKKDLSWFLAFLPQYNGIHCLEPSRHTFTLEVDSCLTGCGGICLPQYYHRTFPLFILEEHHHICHLEMLNVVVAVKTWAHTWSNACVRILCDNAAAVAVLQEGRGQDPFLLKCAREIWLQSAKWRFSVCPQYRSGRDNRTADALSRAHLDPHFAAKLTTALDSSHRVAIDDYMFKLSENL